MRFRLRCVLLRRDDRAGRIPGWWDEVVDCGFADRRWRHWLRCRECQACWDAEVERIARWMHRFDRLPLWLQSLVYRLIPQRWWYEPEDHTPDTYHSGTGELYGDPSYERYLNND